MENKKLQFSVEDISVVEEIDSSQFSLLSVDCFATGISTHATTLSEETLREYSKTILQKPFVFAINKNFDDLNGHDKSEVPGGFIPHNSSITFKTLSDGRVMMSCEALIWKRYCGDLLRYFERDGNRKSVSVEIEIFDGIENEKDGVFEITKFAFNAITALGEFISPAIPDAHAILVFSQEYEEAKNEYEFFSKYDDIDMSIPLTVKENAQKALNSYVKEEKTSSAMNASLAIARYLTKNEKITPDRIRNMGKIFKKSLSDLMVNLMGGNDGSEWTSNLNSQLDQIDEKGMSYFSELLDKKVIEKDNYLDIEEVLGMSDVEPKNTMAADPEPKEDPKPEGEPKEKMSYADYFSLEEMARMFAEEDEDDEDTKEKFSGAKEEFSVGGNPGKIIMGLYALVKKMEAKVNKFAEDSKVWMAENEDLKKFKSEKDTEQKNFAIEQTINEISEKVKIPAEKKAEFISNAEKFEFANINQWQNNVKAACFDFEPINGKSDDIKIIGFANIPNIKIESGDLWSEKIKE